VKKSWANFRSEKRSLSGGRKRGENAYWGKWGPVALGGTTLRHREKEGETGKNSRLERMPLCPRKTSEKKWEEKMTLQRNFKIESGGATDYGPKMNLK